VREAPRRSDRSVDRDRGGNDRRSGRGGFHVFATVRWDADADHLKHQYRDVTALLMDVREDDGIQAAASTVDAHLTGRGLDALVNNAGVGVAGPIETLDRDLLRTQLDINVQGRIAVTHAFLPRLRQARGRIVMVGSVGDR